MKTTGNTSEDSQACIEVCNSLLRGEISAVETYKQTITKFEGDSAATSLRKICAEHEAAASLLRQNVSRMGGEPSTDSGAWGTFAKSVQGTAKMFGESSALKGLQEGEEHGRNEYEDALENDDVMSDCKELVRSNLLPRIERHITELKSLAVAR